MSQPKQSDPHFRLRVPADLKARVAEAAAANNRSMNAEIVARLEGGTESLRDRFAMAALAGIITGPGDISYSACAKVAYLCADAMLAERPK